MVKRHTDQHQCADIQTFPVKHLINTTPLFMKLACQPGHRNALLAQFLFDHAADMYYC